MMPKRQCGLFLEETPGILSHRLDSDESFEQDELLAYKLLIIPGGNFIDMGKRPGAGYNHQYS